MKKYVIFIVVFYSLFSGIHAKNLEQFKGRTPIEIFNIINNGYFIDPWEEINFEVIVKKSVNTYSNTLNDVDKNGRTALMNTILKKGKYGFTDKMSENIVTEILKKECDVNKVDNYGNTALFYASYVESLKLVELLVSNGADINIRNKKGMIASQIIPKKNKNKKIFELLNQGITDKISEDVEKKIIINNFDFNKEYKIYKTIEIVHDKVIIGSFDISGKIKFSTRKIDDKEFIIVNYRVDKENSYDSNEKWIKNVFVSMLSKKEIVGIIKENSFIIENKSDIINTLDGFLTNNKFKRDVVNFKEVFQKYIYEKGDESLSIFFSELTEIGNYYNAEFNKEGNYTKEKENKKMQIDMVYEDYINNIYKEKFKSIYNEESGRVCKGEIGMDLDKGDIKYIDVVAKSIYEDFVFNESISIY